MKLRFLRFSVLIFATLLILTGVLLLAGFNIRKTIILEVDGSQEILTTRALIVTGAIKSAGIQLSPDDKIHPNPNHLLKNGEKIIVDRAKRINILSDGEVSTFLSSEKQISIILNEANIPVSDGDKLFVNAQLEEITSIIPSSTKNITIQIQRKVPFDIYDGLSENTYQTTSATLLSALWDLGIIVESSDLITQPLNSQVKPNLRVGIFRGKPITIKTHSGEIFIKSSARTVGEALAQAGLSLQGLDYSIPNPMESIPENHEIRLIRQREELIIEHTPIQFETEFQPSEELEIDIRETLQPGEYGLNAQRIRVRYQDGVEISRNIDDDWVAREPISRIIGYGTKIVKKIAETPDGPIEYWRSLRMYAVSYRPVGNDTTTASGLTLKKGIAAIDRRYIPFYTHMYIPGYGEALAADVGGGVKGRMIDLGYSTEDYVSWHQWVTVYFLWPPPDNIVWFIP